MSAVVLLSIIIIWRLENILKNLEKPSKTVQSKYSARASDYFKKQLWKCIHTPIKLLSCDNEQSDKHCYNEPWSSVHRTRGIPPPKRQNTMRK